MTTTRPTPGNPAAAVTVWRMRSASFRAGMTTATSSTWDPADMGPILSEPVTGRVPVPVLAYWGTAGLGLLRLASSTRVNTESRPVT